MDDFQVFRQLLAEKIFQPLQDGSGWVIWRGRELLCLQFFFRLQDKIGKGPACVNT
jgi:hypothetical protein